MSDLHPERPVLPLADRAAELALVGGKGASLARLAAAGFPVPPGFHVTTEAYVAFVARNALRDRILAALEDGPTAASERISALFAEREMPAEVASAIREAYSGMGDVAVAVRSSATAEDLPDASFAGQQDTYLDVRGEAELLAAVQRCWASLWTARAIEYRARHGIPQADVSLAVVVQEMVPAGAAGVLFTADPVTSRPDRLVVNAGRGLGESLVSGEVDPENIVVDRDSRTVVERRGEPILDADQITELVRLGQEIEQLYDRPMDIEWAVHSGRTYTLQARPITVQAYEEWNDTLLGDFAWSNGNLGEAIPSVMTPATWSLVKVFMAEAMALSTAGGYRLSGNIGGRFYLNLSVMLASANAVGLGRFVRRTISQVFGRIPDDFDIPPLPLPRRKVLLEVMKSAVPFLRRIISYLDKLPAYLEAAPAQSDAVRERIRSTTTTAGLAELWHSDVEPLLRHNSRLLAAGARKDGAGLIRIRPWLAKRVGEVDANVILTGLEVDGSHLESLGPVVGLAKLARGELDRETYLRKWGHRCPDEFEVSVPRPAEDPYWIDKQLANLTDVESDADALLARQRQARDAAWARFRERYPGKEAKLRKRIDRATAAFHAREAGRSEAVRAFTVLREYILRAGQLTGHGEDLFFCTYEEIVDLLAGKDDPLAKVSVRRATYQRYVELPQYPSLICGAFDPFRWAADPNRRSDIFDQTRDHAPASDTISGFPGAAGVVEGTARVLESVEQSDRLAAGEILVTTVTNVGWTPLFPRASAVVTDIGAPLSHAAIVARELGIPAVVGCGNATMRINSGDRIRVDGAAGTVEVLEVS